MYAVIKTGGKQYKVEEGATIRVEKLEGEAGKTVELDQVLFVANGESFTVGTPVVAGAKVTAQIVAQEKGEKLLIFKFRRRKAYRKKTGHRQPYTALKITSISASS